MKTYINAWREFRDFSGRTNRRDYWSVCFIHAIVVLCWHLISFIALLFLCNHFSFVYEHFLLCFQIVNVIPIFSAFVFLPSLTVRRLKDAGYSAKSLFWLLVPVFGEIALFARLLEKSAPN